MAKKIKKVITFFGLIALFLFKAGSVFALELRYPAILGFSINDTSTLPEYARYFFVIIFTLALSASVIAVAYGGIRYLISFSRGQFTDDGKDWVKSGLLGLLLCVCSYLILYTINHDLVNLRLGKLSAIPSIIYNSVNPSTNKNSVTYLEIPIGTLTETLLTRTMDCYGFDPSGNPIDGEEIKTDSIGFSKTVKGPTYVNHDRADCLLQLSDAVQKKSKIIADISDKLTTSMNQCSCKDKCQDSCNNNKNGCKVSGDGESCVGACTGQDGKGAACSPAKGVADCCPAGVKDNIEHGPIEINSCDNAGLGNNVCNNCTKKNYRGLDEFRCPQPINNQPVGNMQCQNLANKCEGIDIVEAIEKQVQINGRNVGIIDQQKWTCLTLVQQMKYYKEKIDRLRIKIEHDQDSLNAAKVALGKCYLAISYVDFVKTYEQTDKTTNVLKLQESFSDPETLKTVGASKYCSGFNYGNSSFLKKCNDACPDSSPQALTLYAKCKYCESGDFACLNKQNLCIQDAYSSRPCIFGNNAYKDFNDCIDSNQADCRKACDTQFLDCSDQHAICEQQCGNNSTCVLDPRNASSCLFNSQSFYNCALQNTGPQKDPQNTQNCINKAYLCQNGSNEYSGYPDCVNNIKPQDGQSPQEVYSSSFLYNHLDNQKCPDPLAPAKKNSACFSSSNKNASCQDVCPETAKCPSASRCSDCACGQISDNDPSKPLTLKFSIPNANNGNNGGNEGNTTQDEPVLAHRITSPQCDSYSNNDDPLTFYCEENWWQNPNREGQSTTPIGQIRTCSLKKEIPVGQAVDGALKWADTLVQTILDINKSVDKMVEDIIKAGNAYKTQPVQDYCKCAAKFENNNPVCRSTCEYSLVEGIAANGDSVLVPSCDAVPCDGNSCKQLIDYMALIWNQNRKIKIDFMNLYIALLKEPRSDILKQLTYSRQQTNTCSLAQTNYGQQERMLSCTRVKDELISPGGGTAQAIFQDKVINNYCYGQALGKLFNVPLTDNWFCCEQTDVNQNLPLEVETQLPK